MANQDLVWLGYMILLTNICLPAVGEGAHKRPWCVRGRGERQGALRADASSTPSRRGRGSSPAG